RAAHGKAEVAEARGLPPAALADHIEALATVKALRRGIVCTLVCAVLLVSAVGVTWYGPIRQPPVVKITTSEGVACGTVSRISDGTIAVATKTAVRNFDLIRVTGVEVVKTCDRQ